MSDGKIEQVPDKNGMHERVTGHPTSVDTGRTVVPSAVGTTRGAQLGRDHTVAAPSVMVMPDGSRVPVVPQPAPAAPAPAPVLDPPAPAADLDLPPDVAALDTLGPGPRRPVPDPMSGLLAEEEFAHLAPVLPPTPFVPPPSTAVEIAAPTVSVTLRSHPNDPVIRWRARYHEVLVTPNTVVLVWDTRFKYADSPLLPLDTGDLTKLKMVVQPVSKGDLPFSLDVADCGLSFVHGHYEYFVFVRDTDPQPEAAPAAPPASPDMM